MSSHTHFYCEHCQNAVNINTDVCPYCGALFSGVRCPGCDYSGSSSDFANGCPICGYITETHLRRGKRKGGGLQTAVFSAIVVIFLVAAVVLSIWYKTLL